MNFSALQGNSLPRVHVLSVVILSLMQTARDDNTFMHAQIWLPVQAIASSELIFAAVACHACVRLLIGAGLHKQDCGLSTAAQKHRRWCPERHN